MLKEAHEPATDNGCQDCRSCAIQRLHEQDAIAVMQNRNLSLSRFEML